MSPVSRKSGTLLFGMDLAGWGDSEPVGVGCGERFLGSLCCCFLVLIILVFLMHCVDHGENSLLCFRGVGFKTIKSKVLRLLAWL